MKPTKNHYFCPACKRNKMLFATKSEAVRFLKYNADAIEEETGKRPVRAYYCKYCGGWHVTSKRYAYNRTDMIKRFGSETGSELFDRISPLVSKGMSVARGLSRKLKELRHNLKFKVVNCSKCNRLINELFDVFEAAMSAQLETETTLHCLFVQFNSLCELFSIKQQQAEAA